MGLLSRVIPGPRRRFANEVISGLRRAGVEQTSFDEDDFSITYGDPRGGRATLFLDNSYREALADPGARLGLIQRLTATAARLNEPDLGWTDVLTMLRPALRRSGYGRSPADISLPAAVSRPALPFLREFVAVDLPDRINFVTARTIAKWGVTVDEVFAAARENLANRARWDAGASRTGATVTLTDDGSAFIAAKLLLQGWLARHAPQVGGAPVVVIPARDTMVLAARSEDDLPRLLELAEADYRASPRPLSTMAYTVDDHGFVVPLAVERDSAAWPAVHRGQTILAADEYNAQCDFLSACHEAAGIETHVGPLYVRESDDRAITSMAAWAPGEPTWLPVADYVAVTGERGAHLAVPWERFIDLVGPTPVPDLDPVRYAVNDADSGICSRLRAAAIKL